MKNTKYQDRKNVRDLELTAPRDFDRLKTDRVERFLREAGGFMRKYFGAFLAASLAFAAVPVVRAGQAQDQSEKPAAASAQPQSGKAGQAGTAAPAEAPLSPEEVKAFRAIQNELDPARQAQSVDDFAKQYPNSRLLSDAYFYGAYAYQQQNNLAKAVEYGYKSLQANGDNLRSLLMMANLLPQPQDLQGSDTDKDKKLTDAEADANKALQAIPKLSPPNMTPDKVTALQDSLKSQCHASLGMVHLERSEEGLSGPDPQELAKAELEYKAAISVTQQPNPEDYFRLGEVYTNEKKIDEAIDAFSQASKLGQGTPIQSYADQQVQNLKKVKAQSPPPAKP